MQEPAERSASRSGNPWIWVAFFVLLILPLYAIAVSISIRSGLFRFDGKPLSNDQLKSAWTFLAAGLAASATVLGALLTKSHNDRTFALQRANEERQQILNIETNERLSMDSVISGLNLICHEGKYSPKAAAAGGLAALVQLGHPILAMRALAAALPDGAVDNDTATWLIGQVLTTTVTKGTLQDLNAARQEAASLLEEYAPKFTVVADKGAFSWPDAVTTQWPSGLPQNAAINILMGLTELLLSRQKDWWQGDGSWILYTIDEALRHERNVIAKRCAADLGQAMLEVLDEPVFFGLNEDRARSEIEQDINTALQERRDGDSYVVIDDYIARIRAWGEGKDATSSATNDLPSQPVPVPNP